jgi:aldehyde dehydrogenase
MSAVLEVQALYDLSQLGIVNPYRRRYDNFIGGEFVPPVNGE